MNPNSLCSANGYGDGGGCARSALCSVLSTAAPEGDERASH